MTRKSFNLFLVKHKHGRSHRGYKKGIERHQSFNLFLVKHKQVVFSSQNGTTALFTDHLPHVQIYCSYSIILSPSYLKVFIRDFTPILFTPTIAMIRTIPTGFFIIFSIWQFFAAHESSNCFKQGVQLTSCGSFIYHF